MTHHVLKAVGKQYDNIASGKRTAMNRYNDRGYLPGDTATLRKGELDNTVEGGFRYTGEQYDIIITDVDDFGCQPGYVTLSVNADSVMVIHDDELPDFAGIAGWSLALRLAGWSDDCPLWTASLPC